MTSGCVLANFPAHTRRNSLWCWAACAQMILEWNNLPRSQADIVRDRHNSVVNETGWPRFEVAGLDRFALACVPLSPDELSQELCNNRPVAIAAQGHMVVGFGITSDTGWGIRVVDPGIFQENGLQWSRLAWDGYNTSRPITYYQLGSAPGPGPTQLPDAYCSGVVFDGAAEVELNDEQLDGERVDREIDDVVQLFRADQAAAHGDGEEIEPEWSRLPPLSVYRPGTPHVALDKVVIAFRLADEIEGMLTFRRLGNDRWVRFTAQISQLATRLFARAVDRRMSGQSMNLFERAQGDYDWISVDAHGHIEGELEPL